MIGKPGGLTTTETLVKGLAWVVVNPIPGQEEKNAVYLLEQGAGVWSDNLYTLAYKKFDRCWSSQNVWRKMQRLRTRTWTAGCRRDDRSIHPQPMTRRNILLRLVSWIGGHELPVLLAFVGIAAGVWIFSLVAGAVVDGGTPAMDRKVLLSMRQPDLSPKGPPALQESARDITALGGATVLTLLTLITTGFLMFDGKRNMALFLFASVSGGLLVSSILKSLYQRPRPDLVPHGAYVTTTSFPSGHSMLSAVTYLTLGALLARSHQRKRLKAYFLLVAGLLTFLVGLSRVYLGVHWPTDVLAGWTAGACWALLCWMVARWLQNRHAIERDAESENDPP